MFICYSHFEHIWVILLSVIGWIGWMFSILWILSVGVSCCFSSCSLQLNGLVDHISFCFVSNADRVSWWELTVLAAHVHPSVSTMARTLLSGNNIVYSGDPLTDLSLPAFLDKFMEKKPKGNHIAEGRWHGGSQIAPAKKVSFVTWIHFVYSECFVYWNLVWICRWPVCYSLQ